jgi:expansin
LANPTTGVIQTTWSFVDCPITTPLELHNKDGVSQYWFSMQVTNANKAVTTLEVSTDGGSTWTETERQSYNFFQYSSGFGTATVDVRVTSVEGDVVVVNNVEVASGASTTASSNFGSAAAAAAAVVAPAASSSATPTQTATADVSTDPPPMATPTQAITPSETTEAAGIFEPTLSTADYPLPTTTSTPSEAMAPTTFVTVYAPCTTSSAAVTTVTVYSYESCTA